MVPAHAVRSVARRVGRFPFVMRRIREPPSQANEVEEPMYIGIGTLILIIILIVLLT